MELSEDEKIIRKSAARLYGDGQVIWEKSDRWNAYKRSEIDRFSRQFAGDQIQSARVVLDAGCGSEAYDWLPKTTISLDRFWRQARFRTMPVAGDLMQLPFKDGAIDFSVCVASVLNYVPAAEALAELARVTRLGGHMLLHFETSTSLEQLGHERWGASAARINTTNSGRDDTLWIYRPSYIRGLLGALGFRIKRQHQFHRLSALGLRFGLDQQRSARLAIFDGFLPLLGDLADDIILIAERL